VPIEIRHFGAGHRLAGGPAGTRGVEGRVIHSDARGVVSELAFSRGARIVPHESPNTAWFCVIEGGGFVAVGDERRRVAAGEAVHWPPDIVHGAWTERTEMRAIVVEFATPDVSHVTGLIEGSARRLAPGETGKVSRGEGRLAPVDRARDEAKAEGEPE
jgi:quercetin dioxygenase-like cupin family protein